MNKLAPSILAADFNRLGSDIKRVEDAGVKMLHIDVMDGSFVPSISFGFPVLASIRRESRLEFDVHLMIEDPDRYIDEFVKNGADIITVHAESCRHLNRTLSHIREKGVKCGVALNPATPLDCLKYVYNYVDMILIMSVNPGFGGQKFIPETLGKIKELKSFMDEKGLNIDIEVDGGINQENVKEVLDAGANVIVSGTSVFGGDIEENVRRFAEVMNT